MRHPLQLLRIAGLLACLNSALLTLSVGFFSTGEASRRNILEIALAKRAPGWFIFTIEICAYAIYAFVLWRVTRAEEIAAPRKRMLLLIALQIVLTFLLFSFDVFYMVAAELGLLFPLRIGAVWLLAQSVMETTAYFTYSPLLYWLYPPEVTQLPRPIGIAIVGMTSLTYYSLAYSFGRLGAREQRQRRELAALQKMEVESVRFADRVAIARDLHDSMGHHLSALSVHLQLASRLATGAATESVAQAYQLAKELLTDVRGVVSDLRGTDAVQLSMALKAIADSIPTPKIHVEVASEFTAIEPVASHALFRCVQETITNTIRHSSARNLWIDLRYGTSGYELETRDDGKGVEHLKFGNGLSGIRERIEDLGGELSIKTAPGEGFSMIARVPQR